MFSFRAWVIGLTGVGKPKGQHQALLSCLIAIPSVLGAFSTIAPAPVHTFILRFKLTISYAACTK